MATQKHPSSKRHPPEVRERAIALVFAAIEASGERHGHITRIARELDIGPETLRHWFRQAEIDRGTRPGVTMEEHRRTVELERENRELRRADQIFEGGERVFRLGAGSAPEMTRFVQERRGRFSVELMCRTLGASPSTYYLLRRTGSPAFGEGDHRRLAHRGDPAGLRGQLLGLRWAQGLASAPP